MMVIVPSDLLWHIGFGITKTTSAEKFKLIFQPAEEGVRGARAMVEAGIVDDVDYFVGGHVGGVIGLQVKWR